MPSMARLLSLENTAHAKVRDSRGPIRYACICQDLKPGRARGGSSRGLQQLESQTLRRRICRSGQQGNLTG